MPYYLESRKPPAVPRPGGVRAILRPRRSAGPLTAPANFVLMTSDWTRALLRGRHLLCAERSHLLHAKRVGPSTDLAARPASNPPPLRPAPRATRLQGHRSGGCLTPPRGRTFGGMQCQDFSTEFSTEGTDTGRATSRCNRGHHIAHLLELVEVQCVELAGTPGGVDQIPLSELGISMDSSLD